MPGCDGANAITLAERLRMRVEFARIPVPAGEIGTTISVGVVALHALADEVLDAAINAADQALCRATRGGRNRTELSDVPAFAGSIHEWKTSKTYPAQVHQR